MKKKKVNHILWIILMSAMTVLMLIPIIMMLTTAVKPIEEIRSAVFHLLPRNFTWNNFKDAMTLECVFQELSVHHSGCCFVFPAV